MPSRERTPLEWMLRRDRSIVNGSDPTKWNWPAAPTPEQLAEAETFIVIDLRHEDDAFVAVLDGNAQSHGQTGGDAWLYGNAQSHGQTGGYARLDGNAQSHGQTGGDARLDGNAQSHGQTGGYARLDGNAQSHGQTGGYARLDGNAQSHGQTGGCYLDQSNGVHGDESLISPASEEIARLDEIRSVLVDAPERLVMGGWHGEEWSPDIEPCSEVSCGTTHCLAGWAQALSPDRGLRSIPAEMAGEKLLPRSARLFFCDEDVVMKYLKDREYASLV